MGSIVRWFAGRRWLLGTAILFMLAQVGMAYAKDAKTCPPKALTSIDLVGDGPVLVPVTLQGQSAWMILQTDASVTLIYQNAADTLHLAMRDITRDNFQFTLGGQRVTQVTSFDPLLIGTLRVSRTDFMVDPHHHDSDLYGGRPIAGSLAMDLLWSFDVELDLAHKKLIVYPPNSCGGRAVSWTDHYGRLPVDFTAVGNIYFTAEIDGKKLEATIATSTEASQMGVDVSRQLFTSESHEPAEPLTKVIKFASGDLVIPERIQLTSAPDSCLLTKTGRADGALGYDRCYGRYPLVLGRSALRKLHLYFSTKEKVIYFTPADVQ